MIKFEKVKFETFLASMQDIFTSALPEDEIKKIYDEIKLPTRSTVGSAGYDFFAPFDLSFFPGSPQVVPTGVRFVVQGPTDVFLTMVPRSGLGFKYGSRLLNTCGIIDEDYQFSDNEGHILVKMTGEKPFTVAQGKGFCQGIILPYLKVTGDEASSLRNGGFGSTNT